MRITGTLAIANGEPCPWCGKVMKNNVITEDDGKKKEYADHAFHAHPKEFMAKLFNDGYPTASEGDTNV